MAPRLAHANLYDATAPIVVAFREAFKELGSVDGRRYVLEIRHADGRSERLAALALELAKVPCDALVTIGTPATLAAMEATTMIPIAMANTADPVGSGLVRSLARPGGNVTGTAWALDEVSLKWLEILKTVRARVSRVAVIQNPTNQSMAAMLQPLERAARTLDVTLVVHDFAPTGTVSGVFATLAAGRPGGVIVLPDSFLADQRTRIAEEAVRLRLPTVYATRNYVTSGGLVSYGPAPIEGARRAATYVHKILQGAKPSDLPVERPTKFELVVNLKTARTLGLTIPRSLLLRADQVIE